MNGLSVVIPNWNGAKKLGESLAKNYRKLQKAKIPFEIVVVDDASTDDSVSVLSKYPYMRLFVNVCNEGFSKTANKGVLLAQYDLVLIISNDIIIGDSIGCMLDHFKNSSVFAVSPLVRWKNNGAFAYGKRKVNWENGCFKVKEREFISVACNTLFACGGSAVFDRKKFLDLGGFDDLYHPFYWEEIDLCYRAWKHGFQVIHEPRSTVYNSDSGVIKKNFSSKYIKLVSGRNSYLFLWKNIHNPILIREHLKYLLPSLIKDLFSFRLRFPLCFVWALARLHKTIKRRITEQRNSIITDVEAMSLINSDCPYNIKNQSQIIANNGDLNESSGNNTGKNGVQQVSR